MSDPIVLDRATVGGVVLFLLGVIAFFYKREQSRQDKFQDATTKAIEDLYEKRGTDKDKLHSVESDVNALKLVCKERHKP